MPSSEQDTTKPVDTPDGDAARRETIQVDRGNESDISPPRGDPFPIVGVGASAGGLDAFTRLLKALPDTTGMAFVLVQHLDPNHASQLPEILAAATGMPVRTVEDKMAVAPNEVFVMPPNATLILEDGTLRLLPRNPGLHLPIDSFFESLAYVQGGRAIGIVLSGNASDGSQGVKAIKQECGLTFAQDEASAQHIGMPRNAIATGAIDYVLSPSDIARELVHLSRHPFVQAPEPDHPEAEILPEANHGLKKILGILRNTTKVDFGHYKQNTVRRRIGRRMIVKHTGTIAEYSRILEEQPNEVRELYRDLLISVTSFFRDPHVFVELSRLLKDILVSRNTDEPFRVWVPGCSTGEELYSLAICVKEALDELQLNTPIQLFGTDISDLALERARAATYPDAIGQDVSPERLRRYFLRVERGFQLSKPIRESCIFARQDVTSDPPFGHTDLVSCRNLLIYLDSTLQRKVLPLFHYSLNPTGLLLLGTAESIAAASDLFTVLDKQNHIYGRKAVPARMSLRHSPSNGENETGYAKPRTALSGLDLQKKVDLVIQSKYAPAAVLVDAGLEILQFRGHTGFYLEPAAGDATLNLLRMAREKITPALRRAIEAAANRNVSVRETGVKLEHRGEQREISFEVTPITGASAGERYFLVVFEENVASERAMPVANRSAHADLAPAAVPSDDPAALQARVLELEQQLAETRESLRNANEDHEASSEELRAANEEVRSANEELQSTNEELSTTKEELQSANEELTTLNEELQNRNHDLDLLNNDLLNLLSAVDIAFLIVDNDLRLRRFSAAAEAVLNARPVDIGFPVTHMEGRVDLAGFGERARRVIQTLTIEQWDLQDKLGHWYSATIRPYRTVDHRIAGAVIVFVDIDPLKQTLRAAEEARDYAEGMIETVREPLLVLDGDLRIQRATSAFYEAFQTSRNETEGRLLYDLGNGQWNIARLRELLGNALFRNQAFQDCEITHDFPYIGRRTMRLNARRISRDGDHHRSVLLAIEDVTERQETAEIRYRRLFETAKDAMLLFDAETERLTDVNPYFLELTGYGRERLVGFRMSEMETFHTAGAALASVSEARAREVVRFEEAPLRTIDGRQLETEIVANRYAVGGQQVVQVNLRDVTQRNRAVQSLRESEERFRLLIDNVRDYALFQMDVHGRITSWNSGAERLLGYREAEATGFPGSRLFTPEDVQRGQVERELETARSQGSAEDERWHVRKDGSRFFASGVLTSVRDDAGRLRGFAKVMRDMTERKKAEEQLKQQAQLLELAQDIIIVRRLDGSIVFWNDAATLAFGWSKEEALGKISIALLNTVFPEQSNFPESAAAVDAKLLNDGRWGGELIRTRRDGSELILWSRWALQLDSEGRPAFLLEISSDITARKAADRQLRASLREKEVLLKEIHHRVKNNLQVVASLLSLQSDYLADRQALAMLQDMKNRVRSIAAIHEVLYGSADLSRIDFAGYIRAITEDLMSFYSAAARGIRFSLESEQVFLNITQAVPCGLIVNELLTNSFKHAFPDSRSGLIAVKFRCSNEQCVLTISDDGIGLPADLQPQNSSSMGLELVNLLVLQIKGELRIARNAGTGFTIQFTRQLA